MFTQLGKTKTLALLTLLIYSSAALAGPDKGKNETAITVWIIMFNNPSACLHDPCMESDIFLPDNPAEAAVCYLGGQSVQANGRFSVSGRFSAGTIHGCIYPAEGVALSNVDGAEVHHVLQQHGWSLASGDGLEDQIGEFLGNCNPACVDSQFSIHQAADATAGVSVSDVIRFPPAFTMVEGANTTLTREDGGIRFSVHSRLDEDD